MGTPRSLKSRIPSASTSVACSTESTPARSAVLIPGAPCAWTVIFFLWRCTSSTAAPDFLLGVGADGRVVARRHGPRRSSSA